MCVFVGCLLAVEALPLKFHMFQKLWQEVWQKSTEVQNTNIQTLIVLIVLSPLVIVLQLYFHMMIGCWHFLF